MSVAVTPAESKVLWPLTLKSPQIRKFWAKKICSIFEHRQNMWRPLNPVTCCSATLSFSNFLSCYSLVLFCVFGLQDSDSPRHSTASNSSNLSSPPSPISPHKTKSLSLESSDHVSWDSWTASAFRFDITAACWPHGCPLHLFQFSPSSF